MLTIALFTVTFVPFFLVVGYLLRSQGRVFLEHVFSGDARTASAASFLLNIGFYLLCTALLLWNIGVPSYPQSSVEIVQGVAMRLGGSITLVAGLHTVNVLVLALLIRRSGSTHDPAP